eukprot:gene20794-biopygen6947
MALLRIRTRVRCCWAIHLWFGIIFIDWASGYLEWLRNTPFRTSSDFCLAFIFHNHQDTYRGRAFGVAVSTRSLLHDDPQQLSSPEHMQSVIVSSVSSLTY